MASSEMDDETGESSANAGPNSVYSSNSKLGSSLETSRNSSNDEVDLDASVTSVGSRLSHSAARHKMAIRPKKKGPTRHRKPIDVIHF